MTYSAVLSYAAESTLDHFTVTAEVLSLVVPTTLSKVQPGHMGSVT